MQPNPIADTRGPVLPKLRSCIVFLPSLRCDPAARSARLRLHLEELDDPDRREGRKDVAAGMREDDDRGVLRRGVTGAAFAAGGAFGAVGAIEAAGGVDGAH